MDHDVSNHDDAPLAQVGRIIAAAVGSAAVTATLVIVIGQSILGRESPDRSAVASALIRTAG